MVRRTISSSERREHERAVVRRSAFVGERNASLQKLALCERSEQRSLSVCYANLHRLSLTDAHFNLLQHRNLPGTKPLLRHN
jgi:hypothetical protein